LTPAQQFARAGEHAVRGGQTWALPPLAYPLTPKSWRGRRGICYSRPRSFPVVGSNDLPAPVVPVLCLRSTHRVSTVLALGAAVPCSYFSALVGRACRGRGAGQRPVPVLRPVPSSGSTPTRNGPPETDLDPEIYEPWPRHGQPLERVRGSPLYPCSCPTSRLVGGAEKYLERMALLRYHGAPPEDVVATSPTLRRERLAYVAAQNRRGGPPLYALNR